MFQRLFSLFGFGSYLSSASSLGLGRGDADAPDAPYGQGEASFSFTSGDKLAPDSEEFDGDRHRERITDEDLVWPGKTTTIGFPNEDAVAARYKLTLTDLDPSFYKLRDPQGGALQPDGSVLLQPGEEVTFEVCFLQPRVVSRTAGPDEPRSRRVRNFSFVVSRFDPRRAQDVGDIIADLPARWVSLPDAADLPLVATPRFVVIRPWRRTPRFRLAMQNRSYLPPSVHLRVLRAPTKDGLKQDAEPVGTLNQALPARTPGVWQCVLPPTAKRTSYFATVVGTARVAENIERALTLPQPVYVRYIPWLRAGRDWVALVGGLFLFLWLTCGVPIRKRPVAVLDLSLASFVPPKAKLRDLQMSLLPDNEAASQAHPGSRDRVEGTVWRFKLPALWAWRSAWGWNWWEDETRRFRVKVQVDEDSGRRQLWQEVYNLYDVQPEYVPLPLARQPFWGAWAVRRTVVVPTQQAMRVRLFLKDLGSARGTAREIIVKATLNGETVLEPRSFPTPIEGAPLAGQVGLDIAEGDEGTVRFEARVLPNGLLATANVAVQRGGTVAQVELIFPNIQVVEVVPPGPQPPGQTAAPPPPSQPGTAPAQNPGSHRAASPRITNRKAGKPLVAYVTPPNASVRPGGVLKISGRLGKPGSVLMNQTRIRVSKWGRSALVAVVPRSAPPGRYPITVQPFGGGAALPAGFVSVVAPPKPPVAQPAVRLANGSRRPGDLIKLHGRRLGKGGTVLLDQSTIAPHNRWTEGAVVFILPFDTRPGEHTLTLQLASGQQLPAGTITIEAPLPSASVFEATSYEHLLLGTYDKAVEEAEKTIRGDKESGEEKAQAYAIRAYAHHRLGSLLYSERREARNIAQTQKSAPALALTFLAMGYAAQRIGNAQEALVNYETAARTWPGLILAYTARAEIFKERPAQAQRFLEQGADMVARNSNSQWAAASYYELARCWANLNRSDQARTLLDKAIRLDATIVRAPAVARLKSQLSP